MARVRKIGHPKHKKQPKRKAHAYSILQEDPSFCYLCAKTGDNLPQRTEEHHIFFGTGQRDKSEAQGLKVRLCIPHHRTGPEAVHRNIDVSRRLQREAQEKWEETHSHAEWMALFGRNYLETRDRDLTPAEQLFEEFRELKPNMASHMVRMGLVDGSKSRLKIQLTSGQILIYDGSDKSVRIYRNT